MVKDKKFRGISELFEREPYQSRIIGKIGIMSFGLKDTKKYTKSESGSAVTGKS